MKKENLQQEIESLKARAKARNSETFDSGMPVTEGLVITINGISTENKGTAMEFTNFVNEEGVILSDKHIGRRGNGLNLEGSTNLERTLAFVQELSEKETIKVKVVKILTKKALYEGRETLNSYYILERV